jgi:NADH:ubiquinone oxidoreductase subunit F (NADH-binding)
VSLEATTLPRLLFGSPPDGQMSLNEHLGVHGPPPRPGRSAPSGLIDLVARSGLRGRGGAGFPTARKLEAVRAGRRSAVVVANGCEGEPASAKDRLLLSAVPHLVIDGAILCAGAVGAREVVVAVTDRHARAAVERALAERGGTDRVAIRVVQVPDGFVSGEETALLQFLGGGPAKPTFVPPRPFERGLDRRPTLVQNVETLAHVALIARHGPDWFRSIGGPEDPGSALVTLSGAVTAPGVYEIPSDAGLSALLDAAGGPTGPPRAVLIGGYFGSWVDARAIGEGLRLDAASLRRFGAQRGAGVVAVLGDSACGPAETARVLSYLAGQSAGQCGPCVNGLPAIAGMVGQLVAGTAPPNAGEHLRRWGSVLPGRGACHLPDGVVRFAASALSVFAAEFADHHRHGPCRACAARSLVLPPAPRREAVPA